ncbi:hypothetical protein VMCG_00693 [Cytospora schulzeri]|uniref:Uncharacterized protein n=1 Tax=Cytospora schulzeri TaxID=448051 RepID=A0A423X819_9PEZI|nr:hypothetical protein VMCG_00693 [Valsa malicola]
MPPSRVSGKVVTDRAMARQSRAKRRRPPLWAVVALASTASAVSLNDLQPLSDGILPATCSLAYNATIPGCTTADFASGSHCSEGCEIGVEIIEEIVDGVKRRHATANNGYDDGALHHDDSNRLDDLVLKQYRLFHGNTQIDLRNLDLCAVVNVNINHTLSVFDALNSYIYDQLNHAAIYLLDNVFRDHITGRVPVVEHVILYFDIHEGSDVNIGIDIDIVRR